jgi:predicted transcriptional regulator of viral defense system
MRASIIWEKFLVDNRKIVTSGEIGELADEILKDTDQVIDYLQRNRYIVRILKGIFYVKSLEERERKKYDNSLYDMVAMALQKKGVKNWYYALETALKLNTMTHEYYMIDYLITDSYRTTKVIKILDTSFKFIKRGKEHFRRGIKREKRIRYSDPEKTVLDLAYRDYLKTKNKKIYLPTIAEYKDRIDNNRVKNYLIYYPPGFRNSLEDRI